MTGHANGILSVSQNSSYLVSSSMPVNVNDHDPYSHAHSSIQSKVVSNSQGFFCDVTTGIKGHCN